LKERSTMSAHASEPRGKAGKGEAPKRGVKRSQPDVSHTNGSPAKPPTQLMIDLDWMRGLIAAVDESGIDSLEIYRGGTRIRINKTPPPPPALATPTGPTPVAVQTAATVAAEAAPPAPAPAEPPKSNLMEIRSPMVGTFYKAPAPEAPPYVEIGSHVSKGQTLCILEAMKLMNELESEVDGIVRAILAENADPVEYGQVLFRIEPTGA
jgi:acetyl-CoA carboxylase biotin carboxyl carrier protein